MRLRLINKKAKRNYQILEELETGVVLKGVEVKALRIGKGSLNEAYVKIKNGEAWIINFVIPGYQKAQEDYDPSKSRKLLMHKSELLRLQKRQEGKNLALVPLMAYFKKGRCKILVGLARGKKQYEKKEDKKRKDVKRELRREFKEAQIR